VKILVTDDEPMIRELIRGTLARDARFEVWLAGDGTTALTMVRELEPELVILDVRMPGIDGIEVCRQIREEFGADRPAVIMLTAMGQESDLKRGIEAGANAYFVKPFSPMALLTRVYDIFGLAA
jgi:DNA-binding response OmpR family regulator